MWTLAAAVVTAGLGGCGGGRVPELPSMETYVIDGRVTGSGGDPLEYASVALAGTPLGALTNDQGRFGNDEVRAGAYGLTVIYLGYRSAEQRVRVPGNAEETVTLAMVRDPQLGPALLDSLNTVTLSYTISRGP